jgi:hypothetical protein
MIAVSACSVHVQKIATPAKRAGMLAAPPFNLLSDTDREPEAATATLTKPASAPPPSAPTTGPNVRLTQLPGLLEAETTIAVNPTNAQNIVAGAFASNGISYVYRSSDGGQTWTQTALERPEGYTTTGDVVVTFCPDGSVYYALLALARIGANEYSGVFVYRSTDGGLSWNFPTAVVERVSNFDSITDKPWMTCDTTNSPYRGTLYISYSDPSHTACSDPNCRAIKFRKSVNQGATWSQEKIVSDNPQSPQNGCNVVVGPAGEIYCTWGWVASLDQPLYLKFDKSTDGGATFGTDKLVSEWTYMPSDPIVRRSHVESGTPIEATVRIGGTSTSLGRTAGTAMPTSCSCARRTAARRGALPSASMTTRCTTTRTSGSPR